MLYFVHLKNIGTTMSKNQLPENKEIFAAAVFPVLTFYGGAVVGIIALPFSVIGVSTIASALVVAGTAGVIIGGKGLLKTKKVVDQNVLNEIKTYGTPEQQKQAQELEQRSFALTQKVKTRTLGRAVAAIVIASGVGLVSTVGLGVVAAAATLYAVRSKPLINERQKISKELKDSTQLAVQIRSRREGNSPTVAAKKSIVM